MILGWEVHNQGWIRDFSLRSPLCPFFPAASTHLFLSEPETREELPRSRPGRSITQWWLTSAPPAGQARL